LKVQIRPELKGALLTLLGIALILVGVWIFIGVRIGIWTPIEYGRFVELTANLPVAQKLWNGGIKAGDDAEQLIKECRPHTITRYGPWIEMQWFPGGPLPPGTISFVGISIVAKNGKLVFAGSFADDRVDKRIFFNTLTPADETENQADSKAHYEKWQAERGKNSATNVSQQFLSETNQIEKR